MVFLFRTMQKPYKMSGFQVIWQPSCFSMYYDLKTNPVLKWWAILYPFKNWESNHRVIKCFLYLNVQYTNSYCIVQTGISIQSFDWPNPELWLTKPYCQHYLFWDLFIGKFLVNNYDKESLTSMNHKPDPRFSKLYYRGFFNGNFTSQL